MCPISFDLDVIDTSLDLILGINATGGECTRANQMVLWVTILCLKS